MHSVRDKNKLFKEILAEHKDKIYRICSAYLYEKDAVDDLFQEVLLNIWLSLDRFDNRAKLTTWLYRVTLNTTITFNKKTRTHRDMFSGDMPLDIIDDPGHEYTLEQKRVDKLLLCIQKLKREERLIISFVFEGLQYKEIAEILGISTSHVGVKINRIKKTLLRLYENG